MRMLSLRAASRETGLSYHCLRTLCLSGEVKSIRSGKKFYINMASLTKFCGGNEVEDNDAGEKEVCTKGI